MKSNLDQKMSGVLMLSTAAVVIYVLAKAEILKAANAVNPLNPNNIFNTAAVSTYQAVTGSTGTIGTDIYGATHNYLKFPEIGRAHV